MSEFIAKLEHMQRTQDRHLFRLGKTLSSIGRSGQPGTVVVALAEGLQAKEEQRLDPAARELSHIIPSEFDHYEKAIDRLVTVIGVMANRVSGSTVTHVQHSVEAGFELIVMIDDVDFVSALTDEGRDLHAMHVVAQFLCALKGWIIVTERLIERLARERGALIRWEEIAQTLGHVSAEAIQKHYLARATRKRSPRKPRAPRPPAPE